MFNDTAYNRLQGRRPDPESTLQHNSLDDDGYNPSTYGSSFLHRASSCCAASKEAAERDTASQPELQAEEQSVTHGSLNAGATRAAAAGNLYEAANSSHGNLVDLQQQQQETLQSQREVCTQRQHTAARLSTQAASHAQLSNLGPSLVRDRPHTRCYTINTVS